MFLAFPARCACDTRSPTASGSVRKTRPSSWEMLNFSRRVDASEIMDDLGRPDSEFDQAYRELEIINRRLGGIRAIQRFLPSESNLLMLDVAAGACDVSEALLGRMRARIVVLRSEEHTSELQSLAYLVCRLLLEKKKNSIIT